MAVLDRFDDDTLPTLLGYWNAAESKVNLKTVEDEDNVLDSIEMAYGNFNPPLTLVSDGTADVSLVTPDGTAMPVLFLDEGDSGNAGRVWNTLLDPHTFGSGHSWMMLMAIPERSLKSGVRYSCGIRESDQDNLRQSHISVDDGETIRVRPGGGGGTYTAPVSIGNELVTWCLTSTDSNDGHIVYNDGVPMGDPLTGTLLESVQQVVMLGAANYDLGTKVAKTFASIMVIYDGTLTPTQVQEVDVLMKHWAANGTGPNTDTPATVSDPLPVTQSVVSPNPATFTAVPSGQPAPTMQWKANKAEMGDGTDPSHWADANTVLGGVVGATDLGTLNIIQTVPADDGVKLEMWVNNTGGAPNVRPSTHATLNVTQAPGLPPDAHFGPVLTTDPTNSTLTWQYQHSTAGWVAWNDATHPISSIGVAASVSTDGQQAGNILDINAATTAQTVLIQCQATANYQPSGITSNQYTLIIEAAS